jgi:hypothetical protein
MQWFLATSEGEGRNNTFGVSETTSPTRRRRAEFAKVFHTGTRIGFGGYDFTKNVVAPAQRAGGQFTLEQPVNRRLTVAAEWYTGHHAVGYVNPGVIVKAASKITLCGAYQIGNAGLTQGNPLGARLQLQLKRPIFFDGPGSYRGRT